MSGRIDHLPVDLKRKRLLVAELGNNSLGVVDLATGKVLRTLSGLSEPQGVGYEPITDAIYVANAGDGSVRILRGEDFAALGQIDLGATDDDDDTVEEVTLAAMRNVEAAEIFAMTWLCIRRVAAELLGGRPSRRWPAC